MKSPKKIVIVPDEFRGSLKPDVFIQVAERRLLDLYPKVEIISRRFADGGEGFRLAVGDAVSEFEQTREVDVTGVWGPLGENMLVNCKILLINDGKTAVIESREANGADLLQEEQKNPRITTTHGVGMLIQKAIELGAEEIIVGIGGSSTNDCGVGMAGALGWRFFTSQRSIEVLAGTEVVGGVDLPYNYRTLESAARISRPAKDLCVGVKVVVYSDTEIPLLEEHGASLVYGRQKFPNKEATDRELWSMNATHSNFVELVTGKDYKADIVPGDGGAGGLGWGLRKFCGAEIVPGAQKLLELMCFHKLVKGADLIITGEGCFDQQSLMGKAIGSLLSARDKKDDTIPVLALCGMSKNDGALEQTIGRHFTLRTLRDDAGAPDEQRADYYLEQLITREVIEAALSA